MPKYLESNEPPPRGIVISFTFGDNDSGKVIHGVGKMAKTTFRSPQKKTDQNQSRLLWYGAGAAVILFVVIAFFVARAGRLPFELTGGDTNPMVLLRNEGTVTYEFTYTGRSPASLERVIPRIQLYSDQVLVADVQRVYILVDGQQVELDEGYFPPDVFLLLQPGDTFEIDIVYLGQELGWNRIYGFRIQYSVDGRSVDGELTLRDDYYVFVE